jgi:hypothetical protein
MQITLQVDQALAVALQSPGRALSSACQIHDLLGKAHASLEPMHPGTQDTDLGRFFTVDVLDAEALTLQEALLKTKGVTAAFIAPSEELP